MTGRKILLNTAFLLFSVSVFAQFSLQGEIRPRAEYRHGFQSLIAEDEDAAMFVSQRSRLNFGYTVPEVTVFISLQDVRVWGEVAQLNRSDMNASIHEAWAQFPIFTNAMLKLGRQELILDNSRILGNVDWAQQARSHDMALLQWKPSDGFQIRTALAYNQERENRTSTLYTLNNYKALQLAWMNYRLNQTSLSFLLLNIGNQFGMDQILYNQTFGPFVSHNAERFKLEAAAYLQTGKDNLDRDMSAWYSGIEISAPIAASWTARAGFEMLSGTDMDEPSKNNSFTPHFGTNHRFNGHMDYFYVGNHINNVGLRDVFLGANYAAQNWGLMLAFHSFWADAKILDPANNPMKAFLGNELDLMLSYNINQAVALRLGYSQMWATESMQRLKGGSKDQTQNWAWAMVIIKPKFI